MLDRDWAGFEEHAVRPAHGHVEATERLDGGPGLSRLSWRKSARCGTSACVEVAKVGDRYLVRNSKQLGYALDFSADEWDAFAGGVKNGDFQFDD